MSTARELNSHPSATLGWITLAALATDILHAKAKSPGRAGRDWCKARGVPYRRDGKQNWARIDDVRRVLEGRPQTVEVDRSDAVAKAVAAMRRAG